MAEIDLINDMRKNKNIKENENFLSKREFNLIRKKESSKNINNKDTKNSNINLNVTAIENKENVDNTNIMAYTETKENKNKNFNIKTNSVLQEKLKKIFLLKEKKKIEYDKQEIPENLKYNSDSTNSENQKENKNNEIPKKISVVKRQDNELSKKEKKNNSKNNSEIINKEKNSSNARNDNNNKKLNEKKTKSFNQKIIDNYLNEIKNEEKEQKAENKQNKKSTALKDIIEKLKAKKIEKEELTKKENEEKNNEDSKEIGKSLKEEIIDKEKDNENTIKKNKTKNLIPNRDKKKHYKKNTHSKNASKNESLLLPHKTYRDENDEDEIHSFNLINKSKLKRNNSSIKQDKEKEKEKEKEEKPKNRNERIYNRRKKLNSIDVTFQQLNQNKNMNSIINIDMNETLSNMNKNTNNINSTINIYKPKKPTLTKVGSRLKIGLPPNPLLNKMNLQMQSNFFNNNKSTKNIFTKGKNLGKIPYVKKPQLNLFNINNNNSICDMNNESMIIGNNNNNNASCIDMNNLNSSFDSLMKNNNDSLYRLNPNINMNNILTGRITHSSLAQNQNNKNNIINRNNMNQLQLFNLNNSNTCYNINYNKNNNYLAGMNNNNKNYSSLNIEDLLILEEKLYEVIKSLNNSKIMYNECFEFWNYFFNCSLYTKFEKLFTNIYESNEVRISINYLLMTIMICYDYSFNINIINNSFQIFDSILKLNRENLIFIFRYILTRISNESRDNIWVYKLNDLVNSSLNINRNEYTKMNIVDKISNNTGIIMQNISFLLQAYKTENSIYIYAFLQNLNTKNYIDIDLLFREKIFRVENINGSVLGSIFLKEHNKFKTEPAPYLKTINRKPYSLILDLDETLVHFKINPDYPNEGVLRVRPGIIEFLENVDKYYELIIFTAATQEYADLLIDAVEENKIYFEHRLYRQHTVIIGNDFVKDLSRVGRPLDKIAIVDNMPQNFRLQKENGINIKAFWGEEVYDTALIDLGKILVNIAKDGGDIRNGIKKYKDEIVKKVTSNISKH